jgi:hypothetical protein
MFYETTITAQASGFGMYQANEYNGEGWESLADLEAAMSEGMDGPVVELTDDTDLTGIDGVEDIRGRIHRQPEHVYAAVQGDEVTYHGITWREE